MAGHKGMVVPIPLRLIVRWASWRYDERMRPRYRGECEDADGRRRLAGENKGRDASAARATIDKQSVGNWESIRP